MKVSQRFKEKTVFSLEIFPPKPNSPENVIYDTLDELKDIKPDFISVTYGASGGSNCSKTIEITSAIKNKYQKSEYYEMYS